MKYSEYSANGTYEILAADEFVALPIKLKASAKAGAAIKADGTVLVASSETGSNAAGILLYDVDATANPNGAIVVEGVVDLTKCKSHSGFSALTAAALKTAVPGVVCRENIGVNA